MISRIYGSIGISKDIYGSIGISKDIYGSIGISKDIYLLPITQVLIVFCLFL